MALVQLDCSVRFSDTIRAVALPQSSDTMLQVESDVTVLVVDWGVDWSVSYGTIA